MTKIIKLSEDWYINPNLIKTIEVIKGCPSYIYITFVDGSTHTMAHKTTDEAKRYLKKLLYEINGPEIGGYPNNAFL